MITGVNGSTEIGRYNDNGSNNGNGDSGERPDERAALKTTGRNRYYMTDIYAVMLKAVVDRDAAVKPAELRTRMVSRFGWNEDQVPINFPSEQQVRAKASSYKYQCKKRSSAGAV